MASSILDRLIRYSMSNIEIKSKTQVWDKNLGLNRINIVITHMEVDGLPSGEVVSEVNSEESIQEGRGRRTCQRYRANKG